MKLNDNQITFKVNHESIKEITVGEKFVYKSTENSKLLILKFVRLTNDESAFVMLQDGYPDDLMYRYIADISLSLSRITSLPNYILLHKIPTIKDKLNLL